MQAYQNPAAVANSTPALPEAENPTPRIYNCIGCRYVDAHGLVCDVCLRKILDGQTEHKSSLIASCVSIILPK